MGKTKGFIEPKGSRRRVRVRVCRVFDSIEPEAQRARRVRVLSLRALGGSMGLAVIVKQKIYKRSSIYY